MKTVYGLMMNNGNANEMLWDHGVWETEEAASSYLEHEMTNISGVWVSEIQVNDPIPLEADIPEEAMIKCALCGIEYNNEDVNSEDYEEPVCMNCEPGYKENMNIA